MVRMTTHDTIETASLDLLLKAGGLDDALDDLEKAYGAEKAGHKYSSRRRNAKGEWEYEYATDKAKAHAQMAFTFAAAHGTHEQQERALDVLKKVEPDKWPDHVHAANVMHEAKPAPEHHAAPVVIHVHVTAPAAHVAPETPLVVAPVDTAAAPAMPEPGPFRAFPDGSGADEIVTLGSGVKVALSYVNGKATARPVGGGPTIGMDRRELARKYGKDDAAIKRALAAFEDKVGALGGAWHAAHNAMYGVEVAPVPLVVAPVDTAKPASANNFETMPEDDDKAPEEIKDPSARATKIRENREARDAEAAMEAGATRLTGEERHAALTRMGQHLHDVQDFRAGKDDTGMSSGDMMAWARATSAPRKARTLRKYRRQLVESFGDLYFKAGLHEKEPIPKGHTPASGEWTERGGLVVKVDGFLGQKFGAWKNLLKEHGFRWNGERGDGSADGMHADKAAALDIPGFIEAANKIGIHIEIPEKPERAPDAPAAENEPEPEPTRPVAATASAEQVQGVINDIRRKRGQSGTVAVTVKPDGKYAFYAVDYRKTEVPGSFNHIMSNKNGQISGLMEVDAQDAYSRTTFDADLVTEALGKLREANPTFHFYVDPKASEAIAKATADKAEAEKPIPAVEALLADGFALKPYQNAMVRFLDSNNGNAIVGDEMGLGKTLQSLAWVAKGGKRAVVVVPKVVRRTWIEEAHKFFPGHFQAKELRSKDLKQGMPDLSGHNLVTINYESLEKFMPALKAAGFDTIIVDESHRAKNPKAKTTQVIQKLAATMKHRILMSGTAVKNGKDELFTQLEMVKPGLWGSAKEIKFSTHGAAWNKMRDHYLARSKKNVLKDLPEKTTTISLLYAPGAPDIGEMKEPKPPPTGASARQIAAYEKAALEWEEKKEAEIDNPDFEDEAEGEYRAGGRKKESTSIGEYSKVRGKLALAKVDSTVDMVKEILDSSDSKVLVFTESVAAAKAIAESLGAEAILHYGQQSDDKREAAKREFQDPSTSKRVFVSTRPSLAVGATLTAADKVVFNDLPWTAADVRQAEDRCHRVGQKNAVNVYWNVAEDNNFDENVSAILRRKYDLSKKINEGQQLSPEEKAWMAKPVSMGEVMDRIKGKAVGPPEPKIEKSARAQLRDMTRALVKAAS